MLVQLDDEEFVRGKVHHIKLTFFGPAMMIPQGQLFRFLNLVVEQAECIKSSIFPRAFLEGEKILACKIEGLKLGGNNVSK